MRFELTSWNEIVTVKDFPHFEYLSKIRKAAKDCRLVGEMDARRAKRASQWYSAIYRPFKMKTKAGKLTLNDAVLVNPTCLASRSVNTTRPTKSLPRMIRGFDLHSVVSP
jgi:hypothetical protein